MATGKLKWYDNGKGYGFIKPDDGGKDVFLHVSALEEANLTELVVDGELEYDIDEHKGKKTAINVKRIDDQVEKKNKN